MSDLHQYELHYGWTEPTTGGARTLIRLVWAYSIQEAIFQLDFEMKPRADRYYRISEAGPVKRAIFHKAGEGGPKLLPVSHFHVCTECQDVLSCPLTPCQSPDRNDWMGRCQKCISISMNTTP